MSVYHMKVVDAKKPTIRSLNTSKLLEAYKRSIGPASFGVGKSIMMKPPVFLASDKLPHFGEWFMVVTPLGHRLAFRGPAGEWRQVRDGSPLEGVQSWYPMDGEQAHAMQTSGQQETRQAFQPGGLAP
jgi:hypothetical protein